jgi:hypothetical protein
MPIGWFIGPGAFGPEMIAVMTGVLEAACKKLGGAGRSATVRETIAGRIIAAAKLGERDPARLLEAALRATARITGYNNRQLRDTERNGHSGRRLHR